MHETNFFPTGDELRMPDALAERDDRQIGHCDRGATINIEFFVPKLRTS
jgi:hypothetical protein